MPVILVRACCGCIVRVEAPDAAYLDEATFGHGWVSVQGRVYCYGCRLAGRVLKGEQEQHHATH